MKKAIFSLLVGLVILSLSSCKKEGFSNDQQKVEKEPESNYLSFESYEELNSVIRDLPSMSDNDYTQWKKQHKNFTSLYDRLLSVQSEIEQHQQADGLVEKILKREADHFYMGPDGRIRLKSAGELLSHFLSWEGLIKVGDILMRYQNGNLYFTNYAYEDLVSFTDQTSLVNGKIQKLDIPLLIRNTKSGIVKRPKTLFTGNGYVGNSGFAQEYLFANRFESNNRRFYIDLIEEFLIMVLPYNGTWPNNLYWNIDYKLYIKFGHQKKGVFGWNSTQSSTYVSNLNYNADYPTDFPSIFNFLRTPINVTSPSFTLPYASNQYYNFSIVDPPNNLANSFNSPAQTAFTVNSANFSSFYIRATGDGNQNFYEKYYVTP